MLNLYSDHLSNIFENKTVRFLDKEKGNENEKEKAILSIQFIQNTHNSDNKRVKKNIENIFERIVLDEK